MSVDARDPMENEEDSLVDILEDDIHNEMRDMEDKDCRIYKVLEIIKNDHHDAYMKALGTLSNQLMEA